MVKKVPLRIQELKRQAPKGLVLRLGKTWGWHNRHGVSHLGMKRWLPCIVTNITSTDKHKIIDGLNHRIPDIPLNCGWVFDPECKKFWKELHWFPSHETLKEVEIRDIRDTLEMAPDEYLVVPSEKTMSRIVACLRN
ncbi:MAG: hypothetical protein WCC74_01730 [Minisyncoccia bacterium]